MRKIRENKYDKVMRENLVQPSRRFLQYLLSGDVEEIRPLPPRIRKTIIEQETDTLIQVKLKGKLPLILHLEFQSSNDNRMPRRMAAYDYLVHLRYNLEVVSVVIYIGNKKMRMQNFVEFNGNSYSYKLIDIRNIGPELFLGSDNPRETILAVLSANNSHNSELIIKKIFHKLQQLLPASESELLERVKELNILSGLRDSEMRKLISKEVQKMPIRYDVRKTFLFEMGKSEGLSDGVSRGISQGMAKATKERNTAFVTYLLQHTTHSIMQIARLVNVSVSFVNRIKREL